MNSQKSEHSVDVWMAGTIYVNAATQEEAERIVVENYAGAADNSYGLDINNGDYFDIGINGRDGDMLSPAVTLYGLAHLTRLVPHADSANPTLAALERARSFVSGFEDDDMQEGIGPMLADLDRAIAAEQAAPAMLATLREAVDEWRQFDSDEGADAITGEGADLEVNGGDLVNFFAEWRAKAKALVERADRAPVPNVGAAMLNALRAIVFQVKQGSVLERDACITAAVEAIAMAEGRANG